MRPHSLSRLKWKDVIKMVLTEVTCDDSKLNFMVQDRENDRPFSTCNKPDDS